MATFRIKPLDMITPPNFFGVLPDAQWQIIGNNPTTLWFQFCIADTLGERRYQIANPGTLTLAFLRADSAGQPSGQINNSMFTPVSSVQTVTVVAAPYAGDRSLFSVPLTADQTKVITSGTVQLTLVEGGNTTVWNQSYAVKKTLAVAGC